MRLEIDKKGIILPTKPVGQGKTPPCSIGEAEGITHRNGLLEWFFAVVGVITARAAPQLLIWVANELTMMQIAEDALVFRLYTNADFAVNVSKK